MATNKLYSNLCLNHPQWGPRKGKSVRLKVCNKCVCRQTEALAESGHMQGDLTVNKMSHLRLNSFSILVLCTLKMSYLTLLWKQPEACGAAGVTVVVRSECDSQDDIFTCWFRRVNLFIDQLERSFWCVVSPWC